MRYLFDLGHPAHVHYFKNVIRRLVDNGNDVIIVARDKDVTHELLRAEKLDFKNRGKGADSIVGKLFYLVFGSLFVWFYGIINKVDVYVGFGSPYAAFSSFLHMKKSIILDDTENAILGQAFYKRFATKILSPMSFQRDFGLKHEKFKSFMELFYLHPEVFNKEENSNDESKIALLRFVGWNAAHDSGHTGLSFNSKKEIINKLLVKGYAVHISSEGALPEDFEKYHVVIDPAELHNLLSKCSILIGESATMASEAAMLGVPAFYFDNEGRGYTNLLEQKYGLVFNYKESDADVLEALKKLDEVIEFSSSYWDSKRREILEDNINPNNYLLERIT